MLMIYILAGAFSTVASAMGGVDATVNLGLSVIPVHFLAAGVFVISAFMGTATGTSMGTISAIVPIAVGVAEKGRVEPSPVSGRLRGRRHVRRQPLYDLRHHHCRHPHPRAASSGTSSG